MVVINTINVFLAQNFVYVDQAMKRFLDDPNLVMLVVNQHHNLSHPKVSDGLTQLVPHSFLQLLAWLAMPVYTPAFL